MLGAAVMLCRCNECWDNMNADFCKSDIRSSNSAPGSGDGGLGGAIRTLPRSRESCGRRLVKINILVS